MLWTPDIQIDQDPQVRVLLKRGEMLDSSRHNDDGSARKIPFKVYYPDGHDQERLPVVIWSHGFGGSQDGAGFLSRFIAAHGYVVVHPTHIGTDSSLWEGKAGHPWDILRQTKVSRLTTLNRFLDIPYLLNELPHWALENPDPGRFMDFEAIGMSGHSFGALSTQIAAGQYFADEDQKLIRLREERIKAGILYSPVPVAEHLLDKIVDLGGTNIYQPIEIPLLHMTGTLDDAPIGGMAYDHRLVVFENSGHDEKFLLVKDGADHMVYNGTRGKLERNPDRDTHEALIKAFSLAYWEAYLKGDERAMEWLKSTAASDYLGQRGSFKNAV
ncbi:MAG: alpha/beta hydrolase family protein [Alphaproteobacteria bacterium]